jgi:hypothetical protein
MMGERGHPRVTVGGRGPRRARLRLRRIDPWSVLKFTMVLGFALWVVGVVAATVLYLLLAAAGVWGKINDMVTQFTGQNSFKITASNMIGGVTVIGLINVVLFTALATVAAFIYNLCADLVGGIDLTLTESDDPSDQQRGWRRPLSR